MTSRPGGHHRADRLGVVIRLTEAGYVAKQKDGRRNRYQVQAHLALRVPRPAPGGRERTIGEVLALLTGVGDRAAGLPAGTGTICPPAGVSQTGTGHG